MVDREVAEVLLGLSSIRDWQEHCYRTIHQNPELGHQEVKTAAAVVAALREDGYEVIERIGTTGVVGVLRNGDGPVVLMRADMDALPVEEATGLPYASTTRVAGADGTDVPVMHACGHDAHVACLMGAARLMSRARDKWRGTYIALFQPAEELADGATAMVDDDLADRIPKPDVVLAQHVLPYPAGTVGTRTGPVLSSGDSMRITLWGRGSHGSMPHLSVDPVVLAASVVLRLQGIVSREITPGDFAVLTVGRLSAGTKSNIIADHAVLELNLRTFSDHIRADIVGAIKRIVEGECAASGSPKPPEFELYDHYPLTDNDAHVTEVVAGAFAGHFGQGAFTLDRQFASEDFGAIPTALGVPYTYWGVGCVDPELYEKAAAAGTLATDVPANHSPEFAPVMRPTLEAGTTAAVVAALAWLGLADT